MYARLRTKGIMDWNPLDWICNIYFHQGRTDNNGGHRDWLNRMGNGIGSYHYHHGLSAHLHPNGVCPYGYKRTFIINPYTGKKISLGQPYFMRHDEGDSSNIEYYSLNLVSKALTCNDKMGVELALNNTGGVFYACATGDSCSSNLGEQFIFNYPTIFSIKQDNTLFKTSNDRLELLCHTQKAALDDVECYAYISLETVAEYMTEGSCFTDFYDDGTGVWRFKLFSETYKPSVEITAPKSGNIYVVGDILRLKADISNASYADITIGRHNDFIYDLENKTTVVYDYKITASDVGNLAVSVMVFSDVVTDTADSRVDIYVEDSEDVKELSPSDSLISFMKDYEGFSPIADDPGDNTYTIGYGINLYNKNDGNKPHGESLYNEYINKTITKDEAEKLLVDVLSGMKGTSKFGDKVNNFMTENKIQLEQHQFDSLLDLTFNAGPTFIENKLPNGEYFFVSLQMILDGKILISTPSANDIKQFKKEWLEISTATLNGVRGRSKNLVERRLDEIDMFFNKNYTRHERTIDELNKILDLYGLSHVTI